MVKSSNLVNETATKNVSTCPAAASPRTRDCNAEHRYFVLESPLATVHSGCASGAKEVESIRFPRSISRKSITRGVSQRFERKDQNHPEYCCWRVVRLLVRAQAQLV